MTSPNLTPPCASCACAKEEIAALRAELAEAHRQEDEITASLEHLLATQDPPKPSICTWCGHGAVTLEERRAHTLVCAKSPSVQRAEAAEAKLAEAEGYWGEDRALIEATERDAQKAEAQRDAALARVKVLEGALTAARDGLFSAARMFSAINEGDPSADRRKAAARASEAHLDACAVLKEGSHG